MIIVNITSRLGNQMFQLAFGYATAQKLKTIYFLDFSKTEKGNLIKKYFKINRLESTSIYNQVISKYYHILLKSGKISNLTQSGFDTPGDILLRSTNNTLYKGYFQSLAYFGDSAKQIKELFEIKPKFKKQFSAKYSAILKAKNIVIHIRRTDYIKYGRDDIGGKNMCLPDSYVPNCLKKIDGIAKYNLIFISDDIKYAKNTYSLNYPDAKFESNDAIIDLQLLINADILIISNSTFSWWGAYLNSKKAIVYAPEFWLGFKINKEYPVQVIPPEWNRVNVSV
jgi:hypothetical protein